MKLYRIFPGYTAKWKKIIVQKTLYYIFPIIKDRKEYKSIYKNIHIYLLINEKNERTTDKIVRNEWMCLPPGDEWEWHGKNKEWGHSRRISLKISLSYDI